MSQSNTEQSVSGMVQELLGCAWGRHIALPDDREPCQDQAVQIVVLHDGPKVRALELCARHRDLVLAGTTPHAEGTRS
jgi:hypothetical protein